MDRMVELFQTLWMPMVLSAVIVYIASTIIWMATPLHKNDYKDSGGQEDAIMGVARALAPGVYMIPWCHGKADKEAAMAKAKAGPWAMLTVLPGGMSFGKTLGMWFVYLLLVSVFVAYVTSVARGPSTPYLEIFRIAGTVAFLTYGGYAMPMAIWHGLPWKQVPGKLLDGLIYGLLTAGTFAWLWPTATG